MKRRWAYRCTMAEERTGKLSFGNTVDPTGRWCLISGLGVKGKVPNGSLEILKESSKATATVPMTEWAVPESCMQAVGHMSVGNFLTRLNSISKIRLRLGSWRR